MNPWISDELFLFLLDLQDNNSRDWFQRNKDRYERVLRGPLLEFIQAFQEPLTRISPNYLADPRKVGGSLFRIHRDVRFSKNKEPYKTHAGVHFRHEKAKDVHAPGFYLHLQPGECFFGAGIWRPAGEELKAIRKHIDEKPEKWIQMKEALTKNGMELVGDSLKRPPRDYSQDHPLIEDLKRKDFIVDYEFDTDEVTGDSFISQFEELCRKALPLMDFLSEAIGL